MQMTRDTTQAPDDDAQTEQPGLSQLREAVANRVRERLPRGSSLRQDAVAGLNVAISSVPDGVACGILAGVNPIYGLYATMIGPFVGLSDHAHDQLIRSGKLGLSGPVRIYEASPIVGQSTRQAYADARAWLVDEGESTPFGDSEDDSPEESPPHTSGKPSPTT